MSSAVKKLDHLKARIPPWIKKRLKRALGRHGLRFKAALPQSQIAFDPWSESYSNLESPHETLPNCKFPVRGWIASKRSIQSVKIPGADLLTFSARPDVQQAYPEFKNVTGFEGALTPEALHGLSNLELETIFTDNSYHRRVFGFNLPDAKLQTLKEQRVSELLEIIKSGETPQTSHPLNFLSPELQSELKGELWSATSANEYDELAQGIIGRFRDGKILDCGAGYRRTYFPHVVNLEIFPYPSTDVLSVNEELPFRDETFDAVFSLSVLEHVRDPFKSAAEISRVLKKGGVLYSSVPFLQPRHGYPHHYYNMTNEGLKNLFEPALKIEKSGVMQSGLPIWSLKWILQSWSEGLSGNSREEFLNMQVKDLLCDPTTHLNADFVSNLSEEKNLELGSSTYILATKTGRDA